MSLEYTVNKFGMVGESEEMQRVYRWIEKAAPTNARVLITGESGVGKDLVARALHNLSRRSEQNFIDFNVSTVERNLVPSELFGYERGAFTGAYRTTKGKYELADGGTLFLDEIGNMSPEVQASILKVIENGKFRRVGGREEISVDARIISATNRDLIEMINEGKFREDLYHRINVIGISVPPLRHRTEDIPPLIGYLVDRFYENNDTEKHPQFSEDAIEHLTTFTWPGNIRQLDNVLQQLLVFYRDKEEITKEDIQYAQIELSRGIVSTIDNAIDLLVQERITLRNVERLIILKTLEATNNNRSDAANRLGIYDKTLRNKLAQYEREGVAVPSSTYKHRPPSAPEQ